jgi:hypothetical protein
MDDCYKKNENHLTLVIMYEVMPETVGQNKGPCEGELR